MGESEEESELWGDGGEWGVGVVLRVDGVREGERDCVIWRWFEDVKCCRVWEPWWCLARVRGCWLVGEGFGVEGVMGEGV